MASQNILIVEDEAIVASYLENGLRRLDYTIAATASSGEEAIQLAGETKPDLVLMDIRLLGEMDGIEAAEQIRTRFDIPVIYLTAYADNETLQQTKVTEPFGYIVKPFRMEDVNSSIQMALYKHEMEAKLRAGEARFRALFERTNDAVFIISLDLVHLAVNQQAADMLEYSVDELVGMPIQQVIAPEEWSDVKAREAALSSDEIPPIYRRTFIKKSGGRVTTEVSIALVYDSQGNPTHIQSIARDITERVRIQEQLRLQATALESAANGILITDTEGTIVWVNPAVTTLTGYSEEELIGENPRLFSTGQQDSTFYQGLWETILSGEVWQGEINNRRKDGSQYTGDLTITPVHSSNGEIKRFISIMNDVSGRVQAKIILEHLATHDPLTNLPNRSLFNDRLNHALAQAKRKGFKVAVLFMDLDDFKLVNDAFGHEVGDLLLQSVGERLCSKVRESDTVARLGGDEFTILLENISDRQGAIIGAQKVQAALATPFSLKGNQITATTSIGISIFPDDSADADELINFADQAMYMVKQTGKKGYRFYPAK